VRFEFIEDHRDQFPVTSMCQVLNVSSSGYYAWRKRPVSAREMANQALVEQIKVVHAENREIYGSPRIYQKLKKQGVACSENRVARLMRRYKTTTKRNKAHAVAPNVLQRNFAADQPNQKWLADITYIPTLEGWLYLAVVFDLYSRRVVGWAMSDRMTKNLTISALRMALLQRRPAPGLIHHSDQGSQYTDRTYQALLKMHGIRVSMNGVGTWYDNAPMESFFATLKTELVHHSVYHARDQARIDLFDYIESFYNRRRLHSALDYLSPDVFEQCYHQRIRISSA
jgi:putative transposase